MSISWLWSKICRRRWIKPRGRLTLVAFLLATYAAVELIEGAGLWLLKRWGEYFTGVATSIFLPLEVRDLLCGITFTRAGAFVINLGAVIYLLLSKHLFGLRGGRAAYDRERRGEQLLEIEQAAARHNSPMHRGSSGQDQQRPKY